MILLSFVSFSCHGSVTVTAADNSVERASHWTGDVKEEPSPLLVQFIPFSYSYYDKLSQIIRRCPYWVGNIGSATENGSQMELKCIDKLLHLQQTDWLT